MKKLVIGIILLNILGCGGTESGNPKNFFVTAAEQVAPVIKETSSASVIERGAINDERFVLSTDFSGSVLNYIYQALREYEFPRDEGVIDMHNIYKALHTSGHVYETAEALCSSIPEATVQSPFDLGLGSTTYDCAGNKGSLTDDYANGFAIRESEGTKHALLTLHTAADPGQQSHGVLQGNYNETTGDLLLHMVDVVNYDADEGFVVRSHIEGNAITHAFTLRTITSGVYANPTWTSLVGKGISRGAGNYFLFKANTSDGVSGGYFCISAEAGLTDLQTMDEQNPEGKSTVDTECSDQQVDVDAMTFLVESDTPKKLADFTGSTILLSF